MAPGNRIAIIGNAGGGKTTLARKLGKILDLPVIHVDSIQYQNGWQRRPVDECDRMLNEAADGESWIIDGFGNDDVITNRIERTDTVLFVDYPIWRHYWWAIKRQLASRKGQRQELPENCPEFNLAYTKRLLTIMWLVHKEYTPWFRTLMAAKRASGNVVILRKPAEMGGFLRQVEQEVETRSGGSDRQTVTSTACR